MKTCRHCSNPFEVTAPDLEFYERIQVPEPTRCPACRHQRRLVERNAKTLFQRTCDFSQKPILSQYPANRPFPVYESNIWWSDDWTAPEADIDWSRPFLPQVHELRMRTPHMALCVITSTMENSDYINCAAYVKNCYLIAEADYNEDCYYSNRLAHSKDCADCTEIANCELCYEVIDGRNCQRLTDSQDCRNCSDSAFLKFCVACRDCLGCINQRQKQYMILNEQLTKEEYEKRKAELKLHTPEGREAFRQKAEAFFKTQPHRYVQTEHNENSSGNHLYESKNSENCYDSAGLEDCKNCHKLFAPAKDCMDYTSWAFKAELVYETGSAGDDVYNLKFCSNCFTNASDLEYCFLTIQSQHCFGCVGLKRGKFRILNKQYSEEEYHATKAKLIEHMKAQGEYGEYFANEHAHQPYNLSIAMDYFPLSKEEALAKGYDWYDHPENKSSTEHLSCQTCHKNFKIIPQEKALLEKLQVPEPTRCQLCRHKARQAKRPPTQLHDRACSKCQAAIQSAYTKEAPHPVYCEQCYLAEVY